MASGGIDSTYELAYRLKETDDIIHMHHIHLVNMEGRAEVEEKALNALLPKLQAIRPFITSSSLVNHSEYRHINFDMFIVCHEAASRARAQMVPGRKPFTHWTIGTHQREGHWEERWKLYDPIMQAGCFLGDDKKQEVYKACPEVEQYPYPQFELGKVISKADEIKYLQTLGLMDDVWFCRWPAKGLAGYSACGKCMPCKEVNKINHKEQPSDKL